jgi:hypothetical protein
MRPNTEMTRVSSRPTGRMDAEPFFGKSHIVLAVALLVSLAASAPAQSEEGPAIAESSGLAEGQNAASGQSITEDSPVLVPFNTRVEQSCSDGNHPGIEVGGQIYCAEEGLLTGVQALVLNRATLAPQPIRQFNGNLAPDANGFTKFVNALTTSQIVIISSLTDGTGPFVSKIGKDLLKLGATDEFAHVHNSDFGFSLVGCRGYQYGQAYQVGHAPLNISAFFAKDSHNNYAVERMDYLTYQIQTDSTIQIGDQAYPPDSGRGDGGFHVLVLDRSTPTQVIYDKTYNTQRESPELIEKAMWNDLKGLGTSEFYLVFVASYGTPIPWGSVTDPHNNNLRQFAVTLSNNSGATYDLFISLRTTPPDRYAFVGAASPPAFLNLPRVQTYEASSILTPNKEPDEPVQLSGVLARGQRGNWYTPVDGSFSAGTNFGLYKILAQPAVSWPVPDSPGQQNAYNFIRQRLCDGCNPREGYSNTVIPIGSWESDLRGLKPPEKPDPPFTADDFDAVKQQLLTEFRYVQAIRLLHNNMVLLWTGQQLTFGAMLDDAFKKVEGSIKPPGNAGIYLDGFKAVEGFVKLGGFIPGLSVTAGVMDAMLKFTQALAVHSNGSIAAELQTTVSNLRHEQAYAYSQQQTAMGTMFKVIYQDWGKLGALGSNLISQDPGWIWDTETSGRLLNTFTIAQERYFYQLLVPIVYGEVYMHNVSFTNPGSYAVAVVVDGQVFYQYPYKSYPVKAWLLSPNPAVGGPNAPDPLNPWDIYVMCRKGGCKGGSEPPTSLLDKLFNSIDDKGLQLYKPEVFRQWPFRVGKCAESHLREGCPTL